MQDEFDNRDRDASRIDHEASEWFVELQSGSLSPEKRREFERWLAADRLHADAFEETKRCWAELGGMTHWVATERVPRGVGIFGRLLAHMERIPLRVAVPALAAAVLSTLMIVRPTGDVARPRETYGTSVAEIREIMLRDGSVVTLGARSALDVEFTSTERRIVLKSGEAFFSVAKDRERPFLVGAGGTFVRAVGTKFNVHSTSRKVRVAVLEGVVEVSSRAAGSMMPVPPEKRTLRAGQEVVATDLGSLGEVRSSAGFDDAWRTGRLIYEDATLEDVIADMSRYYDGTIELADPSLGQLRVTASFEAHDIDAMINTLVLGYPLQAARPTERHIVLRPTSHSP